LLGIKKLAMEVVYC